MTQEQPSSLATLAANDRELAKLFVANRDFVMTDGALSAKTKTLMTMLCDALCGREDGVAVIADRARGLGATEDEIAETLRVAYLMGGLPALVTGVNAFKGDA